MACHVLHQFGSFYTSLGKSEFFVEMFRILFREMFYNQKMKQQVL